MRSTSDQAAVRSAESRASAAILLVAWVGVVTGLYALAQLLVDFPRPLRLLALAVVPAFPIVHRGLDALFRGRARGRRVRSTGSLVTGVALAVAAGGLFAPAGPGTVLLAGLTMAVVWLGHAPSRTGESILVLVTAVAVALTGLVANPGRVALLLLLVELVLAVVALVFAHGREVRRLVAAKSRHAIAPPESRAAGGLRAVAAALLATAVVALVPVIIGVENAVLELRLPGSDIASDDEDELDPNDVAPGDEDGRATGAAPSGSALRFPDGLPTGRRDENAPTQSFGEVRVLAGAELRGASFLLRGNVLGQAEPDGFVGVPRSRVVPLAELVPAHGDSGTLYDLAPPSAGPEVRLEIRHPAISFDRGDDRLLLLPGATHSVRLLAPRRAIGATLFERNVDVYRFGRRFGGLQIVEAAVAAARFADSVSGRTRRSDGRVRHDDPRWTRLPSELPAAGAIAAFTRERLVTDARTMADVRNVVAFLRREFVYDTSVPFDGLASVERLLNERRGYCQHFALAATVMLRSAGLPARLATGYLVNDWDEASGAYEVWTTDRHAWVEVHLDGIGWVPLDPTPGGVLSDLRRLRGEEPGDDLATTPGDLEPFLTPPTLERVLDRLVAAPVDVARLMARRPDLALIIVGLGGMLSVVLFWTGRRIRRRVAEAAGAAQTRWTQLLSVLAAHGLRPLPGETPRQFAREVVRRRGERYGDLEQVVDLVYRARFGRRPLAPPEERFIDTFTESIR